MIGFCSDLALDIGALSFVFWFICLTLERGDQGAWSRTDNSGSVLEAGSMMCA